MVITSSLLKLYHLLKILYKYFKFSTSVTFTTLLVKVIWIWVDSLLIPKNKVKWHWLWLFLFRITDKISTIFEDPEYMTVYWFFAIPSLLGIILAQCIEFFACQPPESRLLTMISVLNYLNKYKNETGCIEKYFILL